MSGEYIVRPARLFTAGHYPDKKVTVTTAHLDRIVANTMEAPIQVGHAEPGITFGHARDLVRRGRELWGNLFLKPYGQEMVTDNDVDSLSVGLSPTLDRLEEVSITGYPRSAGSQMFAPRQAGNSPTPGQSRVCFSSGDRPEDIMDPNEDIDPNEDAGTEPADTGADPATAEPARTEAKPAEDPQFRALRKQLDELKKENDAYKRRNDEARKAEMTKEQQLQEDRDSLAEELARVKHEQLQNRVGMEYRLPAALVSRLQGTDEEAMRADAAELAKLIPARKAGNAANPMAGEGSNIPTYTRSQLKADPTLARKVAADLAAGKCRVVNG